LAQALFCFALWDFVYGNFKPVFLLQASTAIVAVDTVSFGRSQDAETVFTIHSMPGNSYARFSGILYHTFKFAVSLAFQ
jgi:hypothetical protein